MLQDSLHRFAVQHFFIRIRQISNVVKSHTLRVWTIRDVLHSFSAVLQRIVCNKFRIEVEVWEDLSNEYIRATM